VWDSECGEQPTEVPLTALAQLWAPASGTVILVRFDTD
jgi:hypothetical protein